MKKLKAQFPKAQEFYEKNQNFEEIDNYKIINKNEEPPYIYKKSGFSPKHHVDEHGKNIVRVKNFGDKLPEHVICDRNQKQLNYAKRCFTDMGYEDIKILARGPAIKRGVKIVTDLERSLKDLPE